MAITNYAGLLEALQKWTARSDSVFANRVPDFVAMAEDRICNGADQPGGALYSPALRSVNIETTGLISITDGIGALPPRYLGARSLTRPSDGLGLDYVPLERFLVLSAQSQGGLPGYYTIQDGFVRVVPLFSGDLDITYYAAPEALSSEAPVNTLIAAHPMVYLEACLFEAFSWMRDEQLALGHLAKCRAMIEGLNRTATMRQISGVNLRIQPRRYIP
jgi:hypothetical protein